LKDDPLQLKKEVKREIEEDVCREKKEKLLVPVE
jgi:hypothetical protein